MSRKLYFLLTVNESSKARSLLLYIFDLYKRRLIDDQMLEEAVNTVIGYENMRYDYGLTDGFGLYQEVLVTKMLLIL